MTSDILGLDVTMKSVDDIPHYLSNLNALLHQVKGIDYERGSYLSDLVSLLRFKDHHGIGHKTCIDPMSGLPSPVSIGDLISDRKNMESIRAHTYSPEEARSRLIARLDDAGGDDIREMDMRHEVRSIAVHQYLDMLALQSPERDISTTLEIAEERDDSDLVVLKSTGYATELSCPCIVQAEVTIEKGRRRFKKRQETYSNLAYLFEGVFGSPSNIVFAALEEQNRIDVLRTWRSYIGPFYHRGMEGTEETARIDPAAPLLVNDQEHDVLSLHTDKSNVLYLKGERMEYPSTKIEHRYITSDASKAWLDKRVPHTLRVAGVYDESFKHTQQGKEIER